MSKQSTQAGALVTAALLVVIFVAVNAIASRYHGRLDLTEDQRYTLAPGMLSLLERLAGGDEIIEIAVYMTEEVPGQAVAARNQILDMVNDIETAASGSVEVTVIDPDTSEALAKEAAEYGIQPLQMVAQGSSASTVARVYSGLVVKRGGSYETVPQLMTGRRGGGVVGNPEAEYQITAALLKVTSESKKVIGFLGGHGEPELGDPESGVHAEIKKIYDTTTVNTVETGVVPERVDLLVVRIPAIYGMSEGADLDDRDVYAIDQFMMSGKPVVFLMPRNAISDQGQLGNTTTKLDDLLIHSGVEVGQEVIVDAARMGPLELRDPVTRKPIYTAIAPAGPEELEAEHPITSRLAGVQVILGNPLRQSASLGSRKITKLVRAPKSASLVASIYELDLAAGARVLPTATPKPLDADAALYVMIEGGLESIFAGKEIPVPRMPKAGAASLPPEGAFVASTPNARLIVSSIDPLFVQSGGLELFINTLDFLILGEELIAVRSRNIEARPLELLSESEGKRIETEIEERYQKIDPAFKLSYTMQELQSYNDEQIERLSAALVEVRDAQSEADRAERWFYYALNLGFVPVLLILAGAGRAFYRRSRSRRTFAAA